MNRFLHILACLVFCVAMQAQGTSNCLKTIQLSNDKYPFQSGEKLVIVANYKWGLVNTDVGEAQISLKKEQWRGREVFHARVDAKTYKFYDVFYRVRDIYEGRFAPENLRPLYFHRNINENGYLMKNTFFFDKDSINATIQKKTREPRNLVLPNSPCTFDLMSLFYNSRHINVDNVKKGQLIPFSFVIDNEVFDIQYRYIGKEVRKIGKLGKFRCHKVAIIPVAGEIFDGKTVLYIWISDDYNKLPLYIETPIIVGKVTARLAKFENLRFPLSSKIN